MMSPRLLRASGLLVGIVAVTASAWRSARPPQQPPANWRSRFIKAALQIPFDSDRVPVRDSGLAADAYPKDAPPMWIAVPRTLDTGRVARIESRITSDKPYPRLGIAAGVNYVWSEFVGDTLRQLVIPVDTNVPTHWLVFRPHPHAPPKRAPRLVVYKVPPDSQAKSRGGKAPIVTTYAIGKCTPYCPSPQPWCIAGDTTKLRAAAAMLPSYSAIRQYFARNKVVLPER
jgi:hypothetical protein